jgi:hypothetical protein
MNPRRSLRRLHQQEAQQGIALLAWRKELNSGRGSDQEIVAVRKKYSD